MADPLRLAAALAEIGVARYARSLSKPTRPTLLFKLVSVVCAGLGGGFAVSSFLIYLIPVVGAASATLIVGGTLLVVSLAAAGIGLSMARLARRPPESIPRPDLEALVADAEGFVRQHKGLVLAVGFVAGLLTADRTLNGER